MVSKVQSQKDSAAKAQQAKQSAMADRMKAAPKPAMPARPMGGGMGGGMKAALDKAIANRPAAKPAMPARPMGGGMGARPTGPMGTMARPARPMGGMGMGRKKGGRAKK